MTSQSAAERFLKKIAVGADDECWPWRGVRNSKGYGYFFLHGIMRKAHRIVFHLRVGFLPRDLFVCHACDNPACCNPRHLFAGTHRDNMLDKMLKGRHLTKLTWAQVDAIRRSAEPSLVLAERYGVCNSQIYKIRTGKQWKSAA